MVYIYLAIVGVIAYLLGSINTSIIISKIKGTDIREHGSGNAGLTNTLRTFGKGAAALVLIGDVLKGVIAILIAKYITPIIIKVITGNPTVMEDFISQRLLIANTIDYAMIVAGLAVVLGHIFPIFYKFKGGKGVLTSATVIFMMDWRIGLICLGIFAIIVAVTRYVSVGSVMAAITFPCMTVTFPDFVSIERAIFATILMILIIWCHRGNLKRVWEGTERKLSFKRKSENEESKTEEKA